MHYMIHVMHYMVSEGYQKTFLITPEPILVIEKKNINLHAENHGDFLCPEINQIIIIFPHVQPHGPTRFSA